MPFVNQRQRSACYAQKSSAEKQGKIPKWNCKEFENKSYLCKYGLNNDGFCKKKFVYKRKNKSIRKSPNKKKIYIIVII